MTPVRQNATALPFNDRLGRTLRRPFSAEEAAIVTEGAIEGASGAEIVRRLAARGFSRSDYSVLSSDAHRDGAARRRELEAHASVRIAAITTERDAAHAHRGVRHDDFPRVTLPRLSIQAGWGR